MTREVYYNSDGSVQVEYQYIYSADGQLARQQAIRNGAVVESYRFEYDSLGRLIRSREENGSSTVQQTEHLYNEKNQLTRQNWTVGERNFTETYRYNAADGTLASMLITYDAPVSPNEVWVARDELTYSYDALNRLTQVLDIIDYSMPCYTRNYKYQDLSGSQTTSRLAQFDYRDPSGNNIIYGNAYSYDANGNITQINEVYKEGNQEKTRVLAEYEYDYIDQLQKETRYTYTGSSTTPSSTTEVTTRSDTAGNLMTVTTKVNGIKTSQIDYAYNDKNFADRLSGLTIGNVTRSIQYSDYCNPLNWFNGTDYTNLTWTQGRRLSSITKGDQTYSYEYDMSGVRSVKIAEGLKHEYVTQNGRVVRDYVTDASTGAYVRCLDFFYDEAGRPFAMRKYYDSTITAYDTFHYVLNAQGDVVQLNYQGRQDKVYAQYTYDAWGNVLTKSGGYADLNPLRYRGYYYDTETGFYYLQSRYYDPIVKRFINADSYGSTGTGLLGYNMFAYCENNPVQREDRDGEFWHLVVGGIIGGLIGGVSAAISGGDVADILISATAGAASGVLTASGAGLIGQVVGGAAISMASNAAGQVKDIATNNKGCFDVGEFLLDGAVGAVCGLISGAGASSFAAKAGGQQQMMQLGKQTINRTWQSLTHNGLRACANEAGKAAKYYISSTIKNTRNLFSLRNAISQGVGALYNIFK